MQAIVSWLHANPDEGRAVMRENKSFVFFRELTGAGPIGIMAAAVAKHAGARGEKRRRGQRRQLRIGDRHGVLLKQPGLAHLHGALAFDGAAWRIDSSGGGKAARRLR